MWGPGLDRGSTHNALNQLYTVGALYCLFLLLSTVSSLALSLSSRSIHNGVSRALRGWIPGSACLPGVGAGLGVDSCLPAA